MARIIGAQLAKSATSVAANYRATCNARSRSEFISRLGVVVEEIDESACWLELIGRRQMIAEHDLRPVLIESLELRAIFAKSLGTARANARTRSRPGPMPQA